MSFTFNILLLRLEFCFGAEECFGGWSLGNVFAFVSSLKSGQVPLRYFISNFEKLFVDAAISDEM